jgi:hypothetical protein
MSPAGIGEDHVKSAHRRHGLIYKSDDLSTVSHIGADSTEVGLPACFQRRQHRQIFDDILGTLGVAGIVHNNSHALLCETTCRSLSSASGPGRDEGDERNGHGHRDTTCIK